jgi:CRP/FNR family transcriptional regulator, cyclic AMP receptor protein
MMDKIRLLKSVAMFSELPDEALVWLVELVNEVEHKAGSTIFAEGELGTSMYIIVDGRVSVHAGGRILNHLKEGDVFGELAALSPQPRTASVTADVDTHLLCLSRDPLYALFDQRPLVARGIVHKLCQYLQTSTRNLVEDFRYIQQVNLITTAAANVESGIYDPEQLDDVAQRSDELGQLARVFQKMIGEVHLRERQLRSEVQKLRIVIDDVKRAKQVEEITESDFFLGLQAKARSLRDSSKST